MGRKEETLAEIDKLLKTYGKNSAWARTNSADQDAVKDALGFIEKNLRTVAINYHNEAKKLGTGRGARSTYGLAEQAYSVYLTEFPSGKHTYDMRYAYGELLYKLKKFDLAYEQYMAVVALDNKGKHSEFCAESAIFAAEEMTKQEKKEGRGAKLKGVAKTKQFPSPTGKETIDACDQFSVVQRRQEDAEHHLQVRLHPVQPQHVQGRFGPFPYRHRTSPVRPSRLPTSSSTVRARRGLDHPRTSRRPSSTRGPRLLQVQEGGLQHLRAGLVKLIETTFAKDKDEAKAAGSFMAFYAEFPKSEVADLALNNAAVYYYKQSQVKNAMDARIALIENFPKSKYYNNAVAAWASTTSRSPTLQPLRTGTRSCSVSTRRMKAPRRPCTPQPCSGPSARTTRPSRTTASSSQSTRTIRAVRTS